MVHNDEPLKWIRIECNTVLFMTRGKMKETRFEVTIFGSFNFKLYIKIHQTLKYSHTLTATLRDYDQLFGS